jgi:hypothetical protein
MRTLLCIALIAACAAGAAASDRLIEKRFTLPNINSQGVSKTVPIVDDSRIAGYFRLNRTEDARMFYFLFKSRGSPKDDPVVIWMTGALLAPACGRACMPQRAAGRGGWRAHENRTHVEAR